MDPAIISRDTPQVLRGNLVSANTRLSNSFHAALLGPTTFADTYTAHSGSDGHKPLARTPGTVGVTSASVSSTMPKPIRALERRVRSVCCIEVCTIPHSAHVVGALAFWPAKTASLAIYPASPAGLELRVTECAATASGYQHRQHRDAPCARSKKIPRHSSHSPATPSTTASNMNSTISKVIHE